MQPRGGLTRQPHHPQACGGAALQRTLPRATLQQGSRHCGARRRAGPPRAPEGHVSPRGDRCRPESGAVARQGAKRHRDRRIPGGGHLVGQCAFSLRGTDATRGARWPPAPHQPPVTRHGMRCPVTPRCETQTESLVLAGSYAAPGTQGTSSKGLVCHRYAEGAGRCQGHSRSPGHTQGDRALAHTRRKGMGPPGQDGT